MSNKPDDHSHKEQRLNEISLQKYQEANQDQRAKASDGIVIKEPTEVQKIHMMEDVPGKGKNKVEEETIRNNNYKFGQDITKKKRSKARKKNQNNNNKEIQIQNTFLEEGQPSNKKADTVHKSSEQKASNKEDNITLLDNDQKSRHSFQRDFNNDKDTTKLTDEEANSRKDTEANNTKNNQLIDPGDVHNTYLKLISGTSLEEDKESEDMYITNNSHMAESSFEDDGEEDSTEDGDYDDEMSTEESDEFESVYSESFQTEDQPINHTTDEYAAQLIETFNSNALVVVNVSSKIDKIVERNHLSPRGRGRGRSNAFGGRHNSRGRGGRFTYQQAVVIPQEQNLSN
ncbi:PREDICTED: probable serine/threonine-protein kinase dyrk1 [Nicotiana attenuata]|nr:PREDICTED: probable serine/threonine-protein kinase dyrk1 [Nicotiana attenuata]